MQKMERRFIALKKKRLVLGVVTEHPCAVSTGGCLSDCLCMLNNEKRSSLMKTEAA